ncbi:hypothetical protein MNBD_DELTA01-473 [hydrothermal vent metagenome]|uniref:Pathogenicity locus n=1 Tax=hydrothermal vent metagenome TaxID=652676 RepID=A0A3B0RKM3_9ZZZZ
MKKLELENTLKNLQTIPGVGPKLSLDFSKVGIKDVSELKGRDPEDLYQRICAVRVDKNCRCILYVCRAAVYFAENAHPDPEKLKWWNWKDKK